MDAAELGTDPGHADPGPFDLTPTEEQQQLVAAARSFASDVLRPASAAADDESRAPRPLLSAAHDLGLGLLGVPESHGGVAAQSPELTTTLVLEALAHGDLGLTVACLAPGAVATAVARWGSPAQRDEILPALVDGSRQAALALAEPAVLADVWRPSTRAVPQDGGYLLDGAKALVPGGLESGPVESGLVESGLFVVGARLGEEAGLFLVDATASGVDVRAEPAMGLRSAGTARLTLDGVRVGSDARLGDAAAYAACVRLSRLAWCALAVGTAQAVLDHVTPYVRERQAFGEPISHRQSVAFLVADMAIELQGMRLLTYRAAARAARGADHVREVSLARAACAEHGMRIGSDGVQLLGGHGFVKEHPVERWYRDLRAVAVMEGGVLV